VSAALCVPGAASGALAPASPARGPVRLPAWARKGSPLAPGARSLRVLLREGALHTVCEEARCPNLDEVLAVLRDLRAACVSILTLGQYLRPTREHEPVHRYLPPEAFESLEQQARAIGFPTVYAGVFVRSSYNAFEVFHAGGPR
jgi:lipoate synthase